MSEKPDGSDLVNDKDFQKFMAKMDGDADDAETQWKSQSTKSGLADFPAGFMSQYKDDGEQMMAAHREFNAEWNKISWQKKGDLKNLLAAHLTYTQTLGALQNSNARCEALLDIGVQKRAAAWIERLTEVEKAAQGDQLLRELDDIKRELERAADEVSDAKFKRNLNLTISAVTLIVAPESVLLKAGVAAGGITLHMLVDHCWGKSSDKGAAVFIGGDAAGIIGKVSESVEKFVGVAGAVLTFKFDSDEVKETEADVERLRSKLQKVMDDQKAFVAEVLPLSPKLRKLESEMDATMEEVRKASARSYNAAKNYDAMKNEIKKAMKAK